jgi:hypothetical protein
MSHCPKTWAAAELLDRCQDDAITGCWLWPSTSYGRVRHGGKVLPVHRLVYELMIGPIPDGLEIDHLCSTPQCCNPMHLEPVTHAENIRRGTRHLAQERCSVCGEKLQDLPGQGGRKRCLSCKRRRAREWAQKQKRGR